MCWSAQPPHVPKCRQGGCTRSAAGAMTRTNRPRPLRVSISTVSPGSVYGTKTRVPSTSAMPSPPCPSSAMVTVSVTGCAEQELAVAVAAFDR